MRVRLGHHCDVRHKALHPRHEAIDPPRLPLPAVVPKLRVCQSLQLHIVRQQLCQVNVVQRLDAPNEFFRDRRKGFTEREPVGLQRATSRWDIQDREGEWSSQSCCRTCSSIHQCHVLQCTGIGHVSQSQHRTTPLTPVLRMPTAVCVCPRQLYRALSVGWPAAARNEVACCLEKMARCRSNEQGGLLPRPRSPLLATSAPWLPRATSHVIPQDTHTRRRAPPNMPTTYPALHRDFLSRRCCATLLRTPGEKTAGLLSGHVAPRCYLSFCCQLAEARCPDARQNLRSRPCRAPALDNNPWRPRP